MNDRIRELMEQVVRIEIDPDSNCETIYTCGPEEFLEFGELIVRECLAQADALRDALESDGEDQQALGADWVGLAISRHFGVE